MSLSVVKSNCDFAVPPWACTELALKRRNPAAEAQAQHGVRIGVVTPVNIQVKQRRDREAFQVAHKRL